jgi:hypothetical protein
MQVLVTIAAILGLTALFSYFNERFLKLQQTIGLMLLAVGMTLVLLLLHLLGLSESFSKEQAFVTHLSLDQTLLNGVVALANAFAMILSAAPFVQASVLLLPTALGAVFAGALYIFVMPQLSGFGGLGTMIFAATFLIAYLFHRPQDALLKSMGLCMLVIVIGVENEQTYSFLYPANWFITGVFFVLALMVAWRFPLSFRPEDQFLALLGRFFRSMEFLLSTSPWDANGKGSRLSRWRRAFHLQQVKALPQRLRVWGRALPPAALGETTRDQVQSLTTSLQALNDHLQALVEVRPTAAKPGILAQELTADMRAWRVGLREAFGRLSADPSALDKSAARARLEARLERLERGVEEALEKADEASAPAEVVNNMYRLLGAYRGLSEALVDLVQGPHRSIGRVCARCGSENATGCGIDAKCDRCSLQGRSDHGFNQVVRWGRGKAC